MHTHTPNTYTISRAFRPVVRCATPLNGRYDLQTETENGYRRQQGRHQANTHLALRIVFLYGAENF